MGEPGYVSVLVRDAEGRPVEDAEVTVSSIDGLDALPFNRETTDDEGIAVLDVPPGTIGLTVVAEVEPGLRDVIGEAVVSVREGESVTTELVLRRPLPDPR